MSFVLTGRDVFRVVLGVNVVLVCVALVAMPMVRKGVVFPPFRVPLDVHEHYSIPHRDVKHYTLPSFATSSVLTENQTEEMEAVFKFFESSRGIVRCSHFESEIGCSDLYQAFVLLNRTLRSKRVLIVELPSALEAAVDAIHAAFLVAIASKRRLLVAKSPFQLPEFVRNNGTTASVTFSAGDFDRCDLEPIISCSAKRIRLKGHFSVSDLLLAPDVFHRIPQPYRTHGMFLLYRWLNMIPEQSFPADQLQIGIALEFKPDERTFIEILQRMTEGYTNISLHIWCPGKCAIPQIRGYYVNFVRTLDEAVAFLPQCDKYIGSLGFFASHWMARIRGRGGIFMDPRDTMIVETSNSQSGMMFLMKNRQIASLMCPKGANALQNFLTFHAM